MSTLRRLIACMVAIAICVASTNGQRQPRSQQSEDKALVEQKIEEVSKAGSGYVVPKGDPVSAEVEVGRNVIKTNVEAAKSALRQADSERDPTKAARHMSEAMSKLNDAQSYARRIQSDVASAERAPAAFPAPSSSRPGLSFGDMPTRRLLIDMEAGGSEAQSRGFEGSRSNQTEFQSQGTGTPFFAGPQDVRGYNSQREEITTADGRTVNIKSLVDSLQRVSPNAAAQPFVPAGSGTFRLSPAAQEALAQNDEALRSIGGIALDVTFQRLALVGVPEFRVPGRVSLIRNPVMISLRRLLTAARRYSSSQDAWQTLPEEIRYPGAIGRINGYVIDPKSKDVFIIGTPALSRESRLDMDIITVLMDVVWAKGLTPTISLDPLPRDPGGPQYPRVINLPRDALVTRIMLDADYEMKRINLGAEVVSEPAFESLATMYSRTPPKDPFAARFWLRPIPLNLNAVRVSRSGRAVLYDAGVQALTETVRVDANGIIGTGNIDPVHARAVELFTRAYGQLESSPAVHPRGIFALLHGVIDAATMCTLLRESGIDYPVLNELRQLTYSRLAGSQAIPSYYTGLHVRYSQSLGNGGDLFLSGGIELRSRPTRPSVDRFDDYVGRTLERAADEFRSSGFLQQLDLIFTLPAPRLPGSTDAEVAKQTGFRDLASEQLVPAVEHLREATIKDPTDIDAWTYLGWTEAQLGHDTQARDAIGQAQALGADDLVTRMILLDMDLFANPALDLDSASQVLRMELSNGYTNKAYLAVYKNDAALALRSADRALRFWPDNAEAYLGRALAESIDHPDAARQDSANAVRLLRKAAQKDGVEVVRARLAFAVALNVAQQLDGVPQQLTQKVTNAELAHRLSDLLKQSREAVEQAHEAVTLDPSSGLGVATEIRARGTRLLIIQIANMVSHAGLKYDPDPARQFADSALQKFPDFPVIRMERAVLFQLLGDLPSAEHEINDAISLDPTNGRNFLLRATFRAQLGNCPAANEDLQRANAFNQAIDDRALQAFSLTDCHLTAPH